MRRFYSHYTFIYPDTYLKNYVVELDDTCKITQFFPFEKEIENTEFYSGLLVFLPQNTELKEAFFDIKKTSFSEDSQNRSIDINVRIYHEDIGEILP